MILSMTCATNWMSSCDTISSPNNRAVSKQRSRRDFRWVNSLSSLTLQRIIPLCCKMRPKDFIGTMHRPLLIHLCATSRGTTHCSTSVVCYYQRDNTLQHISCVLLPEGQHTAAHQLCATTRGTTHCSTSVVCYYQRDNTLRQISCVLLAEGQHTAAHQLCATSRGTRHCGKSVVCY